MFVIDWGLHIDDSRYSGGMPCERTHRSDPVHGPASSSPSTSVTWRRASLLLGDVRRGAAQAPSRVRQLRRRGAAAGARCSSRRARARGAPGRSALNHLGVEVSSVEDVAAARTRFTEAGLARPSTRTTRRAATPSRTRCGSTTPPVPRGRSTPSRTTTPPPPVRRPPASRSWATGVLHVDLGGHDDCRPASGGGLLLVTGRSGASRTVTPTGPAPSTDRRDTPLDPRPLPAGLDRAGDGRGAGPRAHRAGAR